MRRRQGFTLIELLVVIAIIAILAAMLFPVFARARESARKIQCLSNVKNIAIAFQMYLSDYDRFPPGEHRAEVVAWANDRCGCDSGGCCAGRIAGANPYLRWPVILDEYVKNRDVWRCPSSRREKNFPINSGYAGDAKGDWFKEMVNTWDTCPGPQPCQSPYPPGWGGSVTDTIIQGDPAGCASPETGAIAFGIGVPATNSLDLKTGQINDPAKRVICADAGVKMDFERAAWVAYPDMCKIDVAACTDCWADWVNCTFTQQCGANSASFGTDVEVRKKYAQPRHMGGSNIGFADGHASWMSSEFIMTAGDGGNAEGRTDAPLSGLSVCGTFYPPT
jgi:prepilin-type N-terminal cleavage/methylation domain-containing protein/prepilin-type processing-associated H-X9-DG protein